MRVNLTFQFSGYSTTQNLKNVDCSATIEEIKKVLIIINKSDVPLGKIKFIHMGRILQNYDTVEDLTIDEKQSATILVLGITPHIEHSKPKVPKISQARLESTKFPKDPQTQRVLPEIPKKRQIPILYTKITRNSRTDLVLINGQSQLEQDLLTQLEQDPSPQLEQYPSPQLEQDQSPQLEQDLLTQLEQDQSPQLEQDNNDVDRSDVLENVIYIFGIFCSIIMIIALSAFGVYCFTNSIAISIAAALAIVILSLVFMNIYILYC